MAAPNIKNPTTITMKSSAVALVSGGTDLVSNASSSSTVVKVDLIHVTNYHVSATGVSLNMNKNGTSVCLFSASVSGASSVQLFGPFILEENDKISGSVVDNSRATAIVNYQVLA